jgi:hypothetical protein
MDAPFNEFPQQLTPLRKQHSPTQPKWAERIGIHVVQPHRSEAGRLQFEAVSPFDPDEKDVLRSLLEGMIRKHEARRWQSPSDGGERR